MTQTDRLHWIVDWCLDWQTTHPPEDDTAFSVGPVSPDYISIFLHWGDLASTDDHQCIQLSTSRHSPGDTRASLETHLTNTYQTKKKELEDLASQPPETSNV